MLVDNFNINLHNIKDCLLQNNFNVHFSDPQQIKKLFTLFFLFLFIPRE
jgi:hypothetical protein